MPYTLPVIVLVFLGTIIALRGLFAAGDLAVTVVGLAAVLAAGHLELAGMRRLRRPRRSAALVARPIPLRASATSGQPDETEATRPPGSAAARA